MKGYIKVHRKIMNNPIWQDSDLFRLWMYCLMKATHKDRSTLVEKKEVLLQPGQFVTGRFSLHREFNQGISPRKQVKDTTLWSWLKKLEKLGNIDIKSCNKYSVISILHWHNYQETLTTEQQQTDNKLTTEQQQTDTNKNVKNVKNIKNSSCRKFEIFDMETAELLFNKMLVNNPNAKKPNLESWANEVRLIRERDKRTIEQIHYLINWTQDDPFWKTNILSISKLRKQWDQLVLRCKEDIAKKQKAGASKKVVREEDFNLDD